MSQQINLYNPAFQRKKNYFSVLAMLQMLALIALGSALFYGYARYQVSLLGKQAESSGKRYAAEQLRFAKFSGEFSPEKSSQMLQDELAQLESEASKQNEILDTLKTGVIGNTEGYSEYMRAFARQVVHGLWLTGFEIEGDGAQMNLNGAVLSPQLVPSYIQRLNREKIMKGRTFSYLQMRQSKAASNSPGEKGYVEFDIQSAEPVKEEK